MSLSARDESAKTLARVLGIADEDAAELLAIDVWVSGSGDASSSKLSRHVVEMLRRTVRSVGAPTGEHLDVEIVVGAAIARTPSPMRVGITYDEIVISRTVEVAHDEGADVPEVLLLLGACYAAAMALRLGTHREFPFAAQDTIRLPFAPLLHGRGDALRARVAVGKAYLAGAGAIGNAFVWALATLDVEGELHVVDPKVVSPGNLGRCVWFLDADVGLPKAERLVARAAHALPRLKLVPHDCRLDAIEQRSSGAWLERLVVAVDSRRARRELQNELPREVFDASTTGIEEVVFHFNSAGDGAACLSCIYVDDAVENAHEQHVADVHGVSVAAVRAQLIDVDTAERIATRHPHLVADEIVGKACDTLFKTLCATGQIGVEEGRTVLAPLSFVSVLAGTLLAIEFVLRSAGVESSFNFWRASPWASPVFALRARKPARSSCRSCGDETIRATVAGVWGRGRERDEGESG